VGRRNHDGTSGNKTTRLAVFVGMAAASFATDIERRLLLSQVFAATPPARAVLA
jgi:hypothetical protein